MGRMRCRVNEFCVVWYGMVEVCEGAPVAVSGVAHDEVWMPGLVAMGVWVQAG